MQRWWVSWPMAIAAIVTVLNVEVVVIPVLVSLGFSGGILFICTAVSASVEVSYWYWFAGWLGRQVPYIPVVEKTVRDFRGRGLLRRVQAYSERGIALVTQVWSWFVSNVTRQMEASNPIPRWLLAFALGVIRTSPVWMIYPMMIGLGLFPLGWIPGILICRKHHVPGAFTVLLLFNAIKTYGVGLGWTVMLHMVLKLF